MTRLPSSPWKSGAARLEVPETALQPPAHEVGEVEGEARGDDEPDASEPAQMFLPLPESVEQAAIRRIKLGGLRQIERPA